MIPAMVIATTLDTLITAIIKLSRVFYAMIPAQRFPAICASRWPQSPAVPTGCDLFERHSAVQRQQTVATIVSGLNNSSTGFGSVPVH